MADTGGRQDLRQRAEQSLEKGPAAPAKEAAAPADLAWLVHELEVHQVELSMQNEELREAQVELQAARDRYFELYDMAPIGYVTLDSKGVITEANLAAATLLGTVRQRLVGRPLTRFMPLEDADRFTHFQRELFREAPARRALEVTLRGQEGRRLRVLLDSWISAEAGSPRLVCRTTLIDLTEQRAAEDDLREREARLTAILDTVEAGIIKLDQAGVIQTFNPAAERMFGYAPPEAIGLHIEALLPGALGSGAQPPELTGRRRNGTEFPVEAGLSSMHSGTVRGWVLVIRDISLRKRREEEQRQAQEALRHAQRMSALGTLASGIAHDFNNLLMGIAGCANLALKRLEPGHPASASIRQGLEATMRGASLTRQLLRFGDRHPVQPTPIEVDAAIRGSHDMLRRLLGEHVRLAIEVQAPGAMVQADPGDIEQVLMNLASNARDAMLSGGTLTVRTALKGDGSPGGQWVLLAVEDTGCGMDAETQARVFEPFFTTKEVGKGTGLGLATVFAVVQRLGGQVNVQSQVGRGTVFRIQLPVLEAPQEGAREAASAAGGGETVLLVEDDSMVRGSVQDILEGLGYKVVAASGPREAAHLFAARPGAIDVLLTDVIMPEQLGPTLAAELKERRPGLAVLFMSAQPGRELVRTGRLRPGAHLIAKPFDERTLGRALREVLGEGPASQAAGSEALLVPAVARRVLVVDDEPDLAETLRDLLALDGYEVTIAHDASEALALAESVHPEAILCDLNLGQSMSGYDVARALREGTATHDAYLVALTGSADSAHWKEAREAGFDTLMAKPFDLRELNRVLGAQH